MQNKPKTSVLELRVLDGGSIELHRSKMNFNLHSEEKNRVPIPIYLIKTENGYVLFDTGCSEDVVQVLEQLDYKPEITREHLMPVCLEKAGVDPGEIKMVILSHLHVDHAGGIKYFPNAEFIVQKDEYAYAFNPHSFSALVYNVSDFDFPAYNWTLIEGDHPIMPGLTAVLANGHTPGTQALVVELPETGALILSSDCCYLSQNIQDDAIPGIVWNPVQALHSIKKLKTLGEFLGGTVIPNHDMEYWNTVIKKHPEFYT